MASGPVTKRIDKAVEERNQAEGSRYYLGASMIGSRCARQLWYGFRGVYRVRHKGRLLRLFQRGHLEEFRFVSYLRAAGYEVRDYTQRLMYHDASDCYVCVDWDDDEVVPDLDDVSDDRVHIERATARQQGPKQWGFRGDRDWRGKAMPTTMSHFAGNADGKVRGPDLPPEWGLIEFKTHGEKSFGGLIQKGLLSSKPTHWVQMQIYMDKLGLEWGLYMAVNKNTDDLYEEIVWARPELAAQYDDLANGIITNPEAPRKISEDPSWFECRFCDYREICHYDSKPHKNCRSCIFAEPVADAQWYCHQFHDTLPYDFIKKGCDHWTPVK